MGYISKKQVVTTLTQFSFFVRGEIYEIICVKQKRGYLVGVVNQGISFAVNDVGETEDNIERMLYRGLSREVAEEISYGLYTMLK